jgi:hypothetical protein
MTAARARILAAAFALFFFCITGEAAVAGEVTGYIDLSTFYTDRETRTDGSSVSTDTDGFRQQYGVTLNKMIYPKLRLLASGIFDETVAHTTTEGEETRNTTIQYRPFVDLSLLDPFYTAGGNYSKQVYKTESNGSTTTLIDEVTGAILNWRPSGLPRVDARFSRTEIYDKERSSQDTTTDLLTAAARYEPAEGLTLRYQYTHEDVADELNNTETRTQAQDGKACYDRALLNGRVLVYADYEVIRRTTDVLKSQNGEIASQVYAFSGLSAVNDDPLLVTLDQNSQLVDNDAAASAGITLGLPENGNDYRNIGLDFGLETEVNELVLSLTWNNTGLPSEIADVFSWDLYTSSDNLNWSLQATDSVGFDSVKNQFTLRLAGIKTRYIKLAVKPLTEAQAVASTEFFSAADRQIYVTELQAFFVTTDTGRRFSNTTRIADVIVRTRLFNSPLVSYDFSYFSLISEGRSSTSRSSTLSNVFSVSQRFSDVTSAAARVGREDSREGDDDITAYLYSATLYLFPLKTFSSVLSYNGRTEEAEEEDRVRHSVFMNNTAALYRGIDAFLSGGVSFESADTGARSTSTSLVAGASIVPRPNLTIIPNYTSTRSESYGGGEDETVSTTRREDLSITYAPFRTLYLAASWTLLTQNTTRNRLQNYNVSWSPLPGSALQLSTSYREDAEYTDDNLSKLLSLTAQWNMTTRTYLLASLFQLHSSSISEESRSKGINLELRHSF